VVVVSLEKLLRQRQQQQQQGGGDAAAAGGPAAAQQPDCGPWWRRRTAAATGLPLKAKRSDLEAEMGQLPGVAYAPVASGEQQGGSGSSGGR
jgi:hypothetical protein